MARRAERGGRPVPAAQAEARRPRRAGRRPRACRPRGVGRAAPGGRQRVLVAEEALDALPQLAELGVEYCEQPLPAGDPDGARAEGVVADPDLRRRGLPSPRRRRRLRRACARDQHQAREVGRHPRGRADGARRPRARPRRDARLHDRVRARHRRRRPDRVASATTSISTATSCSRTIRGRASSSSTASRSLGRTRA